jgi:hypothetical protein
MSARWRNAGRIANAAIEHAGERPSARQAEAGALAPVAQRRRCRRGTPAANSGGELAPSTSHSRPLRRASAAVSGIALCLVVFGCQEPASERPAERSQRAKGVASEGEAQRLPAKPTSPVAAPGTIEPPPRAAEVPQRITGQEDLPTSTQLPVALDFQVETAATIVRGNYRSELNNLESEMKSDGH